MLLNGGRRLLYVLGCALALIALSAVFSGHLKSNLRTSGYLSHFGSVNGKGFQQSLHGGSSRPAKSPVAAVRVQTEAVAASHHEIFSSTTPDGKYFPIDFGEYPSMNPNIVAHPSKPDVWYIVAQRYKSIGQNPAWFTELECQATFRNNTLSCINSAMNLPIAATFSSDCPEGLEHINLNRGPHDARVFNGPDHPYIIYGSQSGLNCFGQWLHDFRVLVDWHVVPTTGQPFEHAIDLQRPPPYGVVEKNWFIFWDADGEMYAHYDVVPRRVFAKLNRDGSVGRDLAPLAKANDEMCWKKHVQAEAPAYKSIHQATNSLAITLCKGSDPSCTSTEANTFIMAIFQHKDFVAFHSVYDPYVMLFKQTAPFELYAISSKPLWISGRGTEGEKAPRTWPADREWNQTEMIYVTSMSWKSAERKYHGYLDDTLFLGFGIEDERSGAIDVVAADVLQGLNLCNRL